MTGVQTCALPILSVLKDMAEKENRLDKALVEQFAKSRCWEQAGMGKGGGHEVS